MIQPKFSKQVQSLPLAILVIIQAIEEEAKKTKVVVLKLAASIFARDLNPNLPYPLIERLLRKEAVSQQLTLDQENYKRQASSLTQLHLCEE
jgi:hypothetical protein